MYNIIYSSSDAYSPFCLTSIYSLLENNRDLKNVSIHILSNEISEANCQKIKSVCDTYHAKLSFIDTDKLRNRLTATKGGGTLNFNISSFLRIFLPELLPGIDKALFIDSDTYINHGIKELYETDITERPCGMIYNQPIYLEMQTESQLSWNENYFNAGVILINLKYWRDNNITQQILDFYYSNGGNFSVDDQSIINAVVARDSIVLPYKYNAMVVLFSCSYKRFCNINQPIGYRTKQEYYDAKNAPVIVHFNGPGVRPWQVWCGHPYTKTYRKALYKCFPAFKLQRTEHSTVWLVMQYVWHRVFCKIENIINK